MSAVFISYAREDTDFVRRLCDSLKQRNKSAWVDLESILPSVEWRQEILAAIEGSDAVVQIISPHSIGSTSCADELDCAIKNNKRIIPILYRDVAEGSLPKSIQERQWIFLQDTDNYDTGIANLIVALDTNIEWVRTHTRLLTRAIEWDQHNRDNSYSLRGNDLKKAESALTSGTQFEPPLSPLQIDYVLASRKAATRRTATAMAVAAAALLVILVFGVLFLFKRQESDLNLAANFREMGISELANHNPLAAEILFGKALSITDNVGAREQLIEARTQSPRLIWEHAPTDKASALLAISSDGMQFVVATPAELSIWSVPDRKQIRVFRVHLDFQQKPIATFGPTHRLMAVASANKVEVWDLQSISEQPVFAVASQTEISSVAISADGSHLVVGEGDGKISSWGIDQHNEIPSQRFLGHSDRITGMAVSADSNVLISGSWDETAKVWNLETGINTATFTGHDDALLCVAISPDGNIVASAGWDDTIWIWDRKTGKPIRALSGHRGSILALAFSSDGKWLVSGSEDHTARLWDVERGRFVLTLPGYVGDVMSAAFLNSKGKQELVIGDSTGVVRLWDLSIIGQRKELNTLDGHTGAVTMIAFDPVAPMLASSSVDRSIDLWDVQSDRLVKSFSNQPNSVSAVAFSPNGKYLASATKTSAVHLWDIKTGAERVLEDGQSEQIRHIAFSPNGQILAGGSEDGKIRLWNVDQGNIIRSFVAHTAKIQGLQFNADGSLLASSSEDSTIKLWETNDWKLKRTFIGHQSGVYEIVFSPNGQLLLSGSDDDTARLWSVASGKEVISPIELHSPVWAVEFSPDGKTIVAGCEDSTVQFWELANSGTKATLHDHFVLQVSNGPVWWLRFQKSAGAVSLGIASQDRTVKILHMDELQTLFGHPDRLENDAKGRGGLVIGQGTDGEPTIVAMPPAEFSTVENEQSNPN